MNAQSKIEASLASAMAAAFGEIEAATKSANNPHFKSKYADLTTIIEAIKPALTKHGLFFTQRPEPTEKGVTIETVIGHCGGEELSLGKLFVPANKNDAQGFGSALTYARRYALVTAFGVPVEDDDGNAAAKSQAQANTATPRRDEPVHDDRIDEEQLAKLAMLLRATKTTESAFLKGMGAPADAKIFQLPVSMYAEAVEKLEAKLAKLAKAETDAKAASVPPKSEFAEILEDDIAF